MKAKSPNIKIALIHLLSKKRQTIVAMLGVTFGIAIFIFQAGLMSGFQTVFIEQSINTTANIRIYNEPDNKRKSVLQNAGEKDNEWIVVRNQKVKDEQTNIKNGYQIIKQLEKHPEIAGVSPFLGTQTIFRLGIAQTSGRVSGVDIEKENLLFALQDNMAEGNILSLENTPNGLILGIGLAELLGAKVGDNITVVSPKGVELILKVVGIHRSGIVEVDKTRAFVNLRSAQQLLQVDGSYLTDINIKLKNIDKAEELSREFTARYGYTAQNWKDANANVFGLFKIQNMITGLVISSILVVSGFGIFNILMMIIYEKMQDIAILKAIGYKDRDIKTIFLSESLIIGFFGGILGLILGFTLQEIVGSIRMNMKGFVAMEHLQFNQSPYFFAFAFVFGMVVTAIAGYIPARKASKIDPVDIIRSK
ncbi:MAG: ABC transporter permease [Bacteroidia bacterium]|nr:ABC transporter permease [Bacteroidia bacterium]